jgi:predicted CoA-substrate-specific enzyme activase
MPDKDLFTTIHRGKEGNETLNTQYSKLKTNAYLGIDVGSISTNLVVLDEEKRVLSKRYLMTAGRPIEAVRRGLREIGEEIGDKVRILGVGTTGSGRYMTGDFVGADIVKNEITAQATAAVEIDPSVDTIFEIGGQDSKFISLKDGVVIDFEMNKVCAAGTGSFLEEQAERLYISIKDEFGDLCLKATHPCRLGERCTVFMETAVVSQQQKGAKKDDIVAGLGYSIVYNYLNKVVGDKKIGDKIFFQGGVAFNKGVVAAFEKVLGNKITVPPHHDVTGAIGMALIAMRYMKEGQGSEKDKRLMTKFKGFELSKRNYEVKTFQCSGCSNICEIKRVEIEGEEDPLYYGSRCERYDVKRKAIVSPDKSGDLLDLFEEREDIVFSMPLKNKGKARIGIPLTLYYYEHIPFLATLLTGLDFEVVFSDKTNREIIHKGVEAVLSEACFPQKVAHGHILNLIEKGVDALFLPSFIDLAREGDTFERSVACPYAQTIPYISKVAIGDFNTISPRINYKKGEDYIISELKRVFRPYNIKKADIKRALNEAEEAQRAVHDAIERRGIEILGGLKERAIVIIGRPYNGCDRGVNLDLPKKLRDLGVLSIPMDFLPLSTVDISQDWPNMYWRWGQKILSAAEIIRRHPFLNALFITNFGCGPDSFIIEYFKKKMGYKPFLQIEIDEHSADAGIITRCEAFLDSIRNVGPLTIAEAKGPSKRSILSSKGKRVVYLPKMADHAYALAAAFRASGVEAEVLPDPDIETVNLGRRYTSGKECYPCTITTGDFVKMVKGNGFNPQRTAFFMPSATGPCRFGQYNVFQRLVLDELGYNDIPIYSPLQGSKFYRELGMIGDDFIRLAWQGIVAVEILIKSLHERRPYEKNKGETEGLYKLYLDRIAKEIEKGNNNLIPFLEEMRRDIDAIPVYKDIRKPLIGIIGEIFVRLNAFTNEDIIKKIEALGGEVWLAPFEEWMYYVNYMALDKAMAKRNYSDILNILLTRLIQKRIERRQARPFEGFLKSLHEPSTKELLKNASPYLHPSFEGEAILSIGKAVDLAKKGASGIINTMPFTCMPGTIVTALMKKFEEDYPDVACLHMAYDGQEHAGSDTRIEAFMFQATGLWQEKKEKQ